MNLDSLALAAADISTREKIVKIGRDGRITFDMQLLQTNEDINVAVNAQWDVIDEIKSLKPNATVIINSCESHATQSHKIIHMGVLARVLDKGLRPIFLDEKPHNMALQIANDDCQMNIHPADISTLKGQSWT